MAQKKELNPRQKALIEALQSGEAEGDIRTAMRIAGYSDSTSIQEAIKPIRDEVIDAASMILAVNSPKAAYGMVSILDDPNALGAKNKVAAAKEILDRAGVVKTEKHEIDAPGGGMFILPPKKTEEDDD